MDFLDKLTQWMTSYGLESWVVQVFAVVLLTALSNLLLRRLFGRIQKGLDRTSTIWDDCAFRALRRPIRALVWVIGLSFAVEIAQRDSGAVIFEAVQPLRDVGIVTVIAWFLVRFIRESEATLIEQRERSGEPLDRTTLDAITKLLRLSVLITAALVVLQTFGYSVSGVLAFGGVGGIAVGFAAKDLLSNFFGGLMIYMDRPFAVGDWIRSPDRNIEGVVENIGWRRTLIRRFDTRPLYVPNAAFTNIAVENPSRMQNRQIYETVGLRYDDAASMRAIVADVEKMLKSHEGIQTEGFMLVNFNAFAASSMDFFIYCYTRTTGWAEYHVVKEDVLLKIYDIVASYGAQVAFPTSTIHLAPGAEGAMPEQPGIAPAPLGPAKTPVDSAP
jgi:MscS family membrane protein